ncbi:MAG: M36 family metallopeptidase [Marmoricola sp.]
MQVCPFPNPTVPFSGAGDYAATAVTSDQGAPSGGAGVPFPPKWSYFLANPTLDWSPLTTPKNRATGCWVTSSNGQKVPGCTTPPDPLANIAARGPWDYDFKTNLPTFTTVGDAANTHEAWASPDSPGGTAQAPVSPTREYTDPFTDAWNNSKCDPTQLHPGGNDVNASVTNLFAAHNRMHDWAYILGFTERNYNLQSSNFGDNPDPSRENDPELGNDQAGAVSGGAPSYLGRDNANQIALQDGIPGITNQYLFQPIAGAFYAPCADGALDMSVVGHEYTHAISNRMIGGPDQGITSAQGGAMGESWSDLDAAEYMFENQYSTGTNPWAVGPYATGNKTVGIRDYAINANPLNYGDLGFDSPGNEVHADGEVWNGTMWEVRQGLVDRWNSTYPYSSTFLQHECSRIAEHNGPRRPVNCPGNRRWIQLMFDSFLLQQGATSMLDARDATLAADRIRFGGANQTAMWGAFARRGMGVNAATPSADSGDPKPGFASPRTTSATVTVTGKSTDGSATPKGKVYVGNYEARATPVADTDAGTALPSSAKFAPGTYRLTYVAPGKGMSRWRITVTAGQRLTKTFSVTQNLASASNGAKVIGSSAGSLNTGALIDDTESTNWAGVNQTASVDGTHPFVTVDLAGSAARTIKSVRVSAMLRPATSTGAGPLPVLADDDPKSGSRFTALRKFAVEVCTTGCTSSTATWKRIYTSPSAAFPAVAPRPVAPNLTMRSFDVPDTKAAAVRLLALENQCTGTAAYAGEQDNDPLNSTDCKAASDADLSVRAAELEVF